MSTSEPMKCSLSYSLHYQPQETGNLIVALRSLRETPSMLKDMRVLDTLFDKYFEIGPLIYAAYFSASLDKKRD